MTARVSYYSDVLCIWAYAGQRRLDQLAETFGAQIAVDLHFCSVFGDAWGKVGEHWASKGGFEGFGRHVQEVAGRFPHVEIHDRVWLDARPRTSMSAHLFIKAVEIIEEEGAGGTAGLPPYPERLSTHAAWAVRRAFFAEARDISDWAVLREIAGGLGLDHDRVEARIGSSEAVARLAADWNLTQKHAIEGSPTLLMNEGRQRLFGNVGYRLIEANVQELLRGRTPDEASWC